MTTGHRWFSLALLLALALAACAPPAAPTQPPVANPASGAPTAASPTQPPAPTEAPAPTAEPTAAEAATGFPVTLTDSLGREVTVAAPPRRIVVLAPSNTEILFALGADGLLVGRDEFSDYPPEALEIESIGSLYPQVNAEAVVALEPDLVLAAGITNADDVFALADLGLTVFATSTAAVLDDIFKDVEDIGRLTGHRAEAEALAADLRARVNAVTAQTEAVAERPTVFYEIDASDPARPWTAGPGSFIDQMLTLAGGDNIGRVGDDLYFQISMEELVAQDPQIIVLGSATYGGQTPETVSARAGWGAISAVQNGNVHLFDDNLVSRPGPRVVDGLETLARLLHPELFE